MKQSLILPLVATAAMTASAAVPLNLAPSGVKVPAAQEQFGGLPSGASLPTLSTGVYRAGDKIVDTPVPGPVRVAPRRAGDASTSQVYGYLGNSNIVGREYGFYRINPTGQPSFLWQDELTGLSWTIYTGWYRDGKVCGLNGAKLDNQFMAYAYSEFDLDSGEVTRCDFIDLGETGMWPVLLSSAYRPLDDKVYGYGYDETGERFSFTVADATDFTATRSVTLVDIGEFCSSMCYNSQDDMFYGITTQGKFVSIDTEGTQTELADIASQLSGLSPNTLTGMTYVPSLKAVLWDAYFKSNTTTALYSISLDDYKVTRLSSSVGAEIYSFLICTEDNADPKAPAVATLDNIDLPGTALQGTATYTLPGKTQDGSALTGNLKWTLYVDGIMWETGTAAAGSKLSVPLTDLENGNRTFALVTEAGDLKSVACILHRWVGSDTPAAPTDAKLTENTVTWTAPTTSVHGGYVDFGDITYTIMLNDEKIGEVKNATSFSYTLPQGKPFTSYTAYVTATFDNKTSEPATSNFITYGEPIALPVHYRPEEKELELMTLINVDGHKYESGVEDTWRFTTDMGFPSFASGFNGDDWLILPPMAFTSTDKAYRFEMEIGLVHDSDTSGTYEVCLGTAPTAEAMTRVIIPKSHCLHMLGDILEEFFAVSEPGTYYIGIHAVTNKVSFHVSDIDISLSDRAADVPQGVTELEAVPGTDGALTASVSFKMPEYTAAGRMIDPSTVITAEVASVAAVLGYPQYDTPVESKTVTGTPGSVHTVEIATAQNYNKINVTCSIDGRAGKAETAIVYTGVVRPYLVNNLKGTISEDNMSVTLTWTAPTEAEDEGPIGTDFTYEIYYYNEGWEFGDDVTPGETSYTYTLRDGAELQYVMLGVMARNASGLSHYIAGLPFTIGTPLSLPWDDNLTTPDSYENMVIVRPSEEYQNTYWTLDDPTTISPLFTNPNRLAWIGYIGDESTNLKTMVSLPKVSTAGKDGVKMTFTYWAGVAAAKMRLKAETFGMTEPILLAELPAGQGWTTHTVDFPASLCNRGWVTVYVEADLADNQTYAMFSGYTISGTGGVNGIADDSEGTITAARGMLTVAGLAGRNLVVCDIAGRVVIAEDRLADINSYCLAPGTYIVRAGTKTAKVVVK